MQVLETNILDSKILVPDVFTDKRGSIFEIWNKQKMLDCGIENVFVQDNVISSAKGVLRGVHTQKCFPQSKLVSCLQGRVLDVMVDCRIGSPTFRVWHAELISSENKKALFVPQGVAHGFYSIDDSLLLMKVSTHYTQGDEIGFLWNDKNINIQWQIEDEKSLILADKDSVWGSFEDMIEEINKSRR